MKSLLLIGAMAAGAATVSAPETAKADHCYPGGYRTGHGVSYGGAYYAPRSYGYNTYSPGIYGGSRHFGSRYGYGGRRGYGYRSGYGRGYGGFGIGIRTRNFGFGFYR